MGTVRSCSSSSPRTASRSTSRRVEAAKRQLISELFRGIEGGTGIRPHSVEITIVETPKVNWGIRGMNAQDLSLGCTVEL
ncbi:tautomerase family protein [Brachybacterium squillarum]|uniref:tautomerase family protein n=1 Tax=Brachybacterium squillarum TaxID=661979 RepID=UPI0022229227|nr:tautomerase family protein [Brachybacterium squillarum]MCW1804892.1 tautomerase family protein [Brachybacterium squillarum]